MQRKETDRQRCQSQLDMCDQKGFFNDLLLLLSVSAVPGGLSGEAVSFSFFSPCFRLNTLCMF